MESFLCFLLRLLLVPLGAAAAITVAMMVVLVAHWNEIVALANADPDAQGNWLIALVFAGPILAILLSMTLVVTAMPAAVGVLIAEAFAIRSWMFHALNGGLSAWIGWSIMQDAQDRYRFLTEPRVMVAAGLAGGLAYWLIAGWTAGFWKPVFGPEPARV
jgi:CDP-diglyceride synthetase